MDTLYEKLQLAARNNIPAEQVSMIIEEFPLLDTKNEKDKNALQIADFVLNEKSAITLANLKKSLRVIYWKLEGKAHKDSIAGLAWPEENISVFFSGKVLDP